MNRVYDSVWCACVLPMCVWKSDFFCCMKGFLHTYEHTTLNYNFGINNFKIILEINWHDKHTPHTLVCNSQCSNVNQYALCFVCVSTHLGEKQYVDDRERKHHTQINWLVVSIQLYIYPAWLFRAAFDISCLLLVAYRTSPCF